MIPEDQPQRRLKVVACRILSSLTSLNPTPISQHDSQSLFPHCQVWPPSPFLSHPKNPTPHHAVFSDTSESSCLVAYLYPGYASYKTLSQRPANEADIERWLMYWSIIGCVVAVESVEWLINWSVLPSKSISLTHRSDCECVSPSRLPLYHLAKTIFILYLVLPQTKGSSYLYTRHLQPFFHTYEPQIDATLFSLKARSYAFIQERLRGLWGSVATSMSQPAAANDLNEGLTDHAMNRGAPPSMQDPVSGPATLMGSLLSSFGPNILMQGMAFMSTAQNAAATRTNEARKQNLETPGNSRMNIHDRRGSSESVEDKKKRLEAELASLSSNGVQGYQVDSPNMGTGRFEEVGVPSDSEGDDGQGYRRPTQAKSNSWFGWVSNTAGYERIKTE